MKQIDSFKVYPSSIEVKEGEYYYGVYVESVSDNAEYPNIVWTSSNPDVVIVEAFDRYIYRNGTASAIVYGISQGSAIITAMAADGSCKAQCSVTVTKNIPVKSVNIDLSGKLMMVGESAFLHEIISPFNATDKSVKWRSTDKRVVTVNPDSGLIMAQGEGIATIYAQAQDGSGKKDYCVITVKQTLQKTAVSIFKLLIENGGIGASDIEYTNDGLFFVTRPLSAILFWLDADELLHELDYYDEWYIFAVKNGLSIKYGLCNMRTGKKTAVYNASPGVTIPLVSFNFNVINNCFDSPTQENTVRLKNELDKVISANENKHDDEIVGYFASVMSKGAYFIAEKYVNLISQTGRNGVISVPDNFVSILNDIEIINTQLENILLYANARSMLECELNNLMRLPDRLIKNNKDAGYKVYNESERTINIKDENNLTIYEKRALLTVFTATANFNSFAAKVQFFADVINNWEFKAKVFGDKWYKEALKVEMSIGNEAQRGYHDDYYNLTGSLVLAQAAIHGDK